MVSFNWFEMISWFLVSVGDHHVEILVGWPVKFLYNVYQNFAPFWLVYFIKTLIEEGILHALL